ncbi:MAG: CoA-binding protein [Thermodesulfobacteriota bacterium]|nr:CoA-binding protein [Thermodesulfobacteriota bacterium]
MDLDRLFYPKSIAVIGASAKLGGGKLPYYHILKVIGYKGDLYPVNPKYEEIDGVKCYSSMDDLPEGIDLAIVTTPIRESLNIIKAAARRKIKFIHFFTAGFSEAGNRDLEKELLEIAHSNGIRIVGPNCIGIYCPEGGVSFGFSVQESPSMDVAFFGQSGGVTSNFVRSAISNRIGLNKVVSYGNQIDIRAEDYLEYFAKDENIRIIAGYIEDLKEPRTFLEILKQTTDVKPVLLLKGGMTEVGASHTGAMASNFLLWDSAMRQHGAIIVENFEQLINLVMLGTGEKTPRGPRAGFLAAGGGAAVTFTDLASLGGLVLPELQKKTRELIGRNISDVNTSTSNPVDLGMFGFDFKIMSHTIEAMDQDDGIDVIIPFFSVDFISTFQKDQLESGPRIIIESAKKTKKPVIPVLSRYSQDNLDMEQSRISMYSAFRSAGLPVFSNVQDCIYSISKYLEWKNGGGKGI